MRELAPRERDVAEAAAQVAFDVVAALEAAGIPCAIGGAHALGYWGVPRGTTDADVSAFVREDRHGELLDALARAGCTFDRELALRRAREGDTVFAYLRGYRVDVFVWLVPFHDEVQRTVHVAEIEGRRVPFISAEALCVFKLLFFREKDLLDLKLLVAARADRLDHGWIRRHLVDLVGDDERIAAWDRIVREHGPRHE